MRFECHGYLAFLLIIIAACGRVEEPQTRRPPNPNTALSERTRDAADRNERALEPALASASNRCLVPTPDQPPSKAARAQRCPPDPGPKPKLAHGTIRFIDAPDRPELSVEITRREDEQARGLMYRTELAKNSGMIFSYEEDEVRTFWMRNTCIPLDMLFVAHDGTIVGILEEVPTLNDAPRRVACPATHVVEVNAGYTRAHGIKAGQKIDLPP